MLDEVGEGVVEIAGWLLKSAEHDFDSGGTESGNALAADLRIRILGCNDGSADAGFDEGVGAGTSSSVMGTGFQGDVSCRSGWIDATFVRLFECGDLSVVAISVEVRAFGDDRAAFDQDATYLRIGRGESDAFAGEDERSLHEDFIGEYVRHTLMRISCGI